ncbi:Spy/CpxP family protein refolding chaperone [Acetobacter conturbans]|uniref:Periplasmic heavy metal sensor n=1 Tax=Acetobacter conturbans TaxID=1737472 RepID=A0ABX0K042_9PROT|nr:periplasmic heavy metal sensor [Acetobacter conturbans]NHN89086.1 periplasmic heavy metal sensor [Acetobacter conturbans]
MKRSSFLIAALAVGSLAVGQAHATPGPAPMGPPGAPGPGHAFLPFLEGTDLTAKQKDAVKKIMHDGHDSMKAFHKQERDLHTQFDALLLAPGKVDQTKFNDLLQQQDDLEAKENAAHLTTAVKIRDILTADQLAAAKDRHDKIGALMDQIHQIEHGKDKDEE